MTQERGNEATTTDRIRKREENRRRLHEVLNPAFMSAEQNKDIPNYPAKGWQDEGCIGRWDGFKALWGTYKTVSDHELKFLTYVPVDIRKERRPLLISWHGGGFFTGAADYTPWDAQYVADLAREVNAIVVLCNYRLLPYVNGSALLSDVDDALAFIQSGLEAFLEDAAPGVAIDWNKVMVTGESAGGFLSAHTWLKSSIPLKLVYLRYPMLVHYQRQPGGYGGVPIAKEKYLELAQAAVEEVDRVRRSEEHMPIESSLHPPINMPAANIFSSTDRWKNAFEHPDILELLKDRTDRPLTRPKILIVHGKRDVACSIENSFKFKKVVENRGWSNEEVDVVAVSDMDHGFDYDLQSSADGFEWLAEVVSKVRDAWIGDI